MRGLKDKTREILIGPNSSLRSRRFYYGLRSLAYLFRSAEDRRRIVLALTHRGLFQPGLRTLDDRYPDIFRFVRDQIADAPTVRLLSFGCATGAEAFTLRRYFPTAQIKGVDISADAIAECRRRWSADGQDPGLSFEQASSAAAEPAEAYDAVFAMAVYRHGALNDGPPHCDPLIDFARFERSIALLARCLRPGGLLIIRHSFFRFNDCAIAGEFRQIMTCDAPDDPPDVAYDRHNRLTARDATEEGVFQKLLR